MVKRVLHEIDLTKIAIVPEPCQEPARATIIKSKAEAKGKSGQSGKTGSEGAPMSKITKMLGLADDASEDDILEGFAKGNKATDDKITELQGLLAKQAAFSALDDEERAYYATLAKADQAKADKYAGMTPAERKKAMAADNDAGDMVKAADGTVIRKSIVGESVFAMFKAQAAEIESGRAELAKSREAAEENDLRAICKSYSSISGKDEEKIEILKALKKSGSAEAMKKNLAIWDIAERMTKAAMTRSGTGGGEGDGGDEDNPEAKLNKMAKEKAAKDNMPFAKAYTSVINTSEGRALYDQIGTVQ